jgi:hypothetical protein
MVLVCFLMFRESAVAVSLRTEAGGPLDNSSWEAGILLLSGGIPEKFGANKSPTGAGIEPKAKRRRTPERTRGSW